MNEKEFREWFESIPEDKTFNAKIDFAICVDKAMRAYGMSKTDLAKKLNVKPARITKILSGEANLTISSMVNVACALGYIFRMHFEKDIQDVRWAGLVKERSNYTEAWKVIDKVRAKNELFITA